MLKVAHHGSATASSDVLLATLSRRCRRLRRGEQPVRPPERATMARLRAHSSRSSGRTRNGTVETTLDSAVTVTSSPAGGRTPASSGLLGVGRRGRAVHLLYDARRCPSRAVARARHFFSRWSPRRGTCAIRGPSRRRRRGWPGGRVRPVDRSIAAWWRRPRCCMTSTSSNGEAGGGGAGPRRRLGRVAGPARLPGTRAGDRRASGDAPRRRRLVRAAGSRRPRPRR
jgi:hypothetical protein